MYKLNINDSDSDSDSGSNSNGYNGMHGNDDQKLAAKRKFFKGKDFKSQSLQLQKQLS